MDDSTRAVFYKAFREADYLWIVISLILGWISHLIRAWRWKYLLDPLELKPKFWHRYHALMIGYIVNLAIPRAGEATRAAMLYRTDKIPFSKSFGTIIGERLIDLLMLLIIMALALLFSYEEIMSLKEKISSNNTSSEDSNNMLYISIGLVFFLALRLIFWKKLANFRQRVKKFFREVMVGVFSIFKSPQPFHFIFYTLLMWILYVVFFGICFLSFEETAGFSLGGILVGFIAGTFGIMLTNGGIGAYPYLVGLVVAFYLPNETQDTDGIGKALGMLIWSSQTMGMIILGLISFIFIPRNYKKEQDESLG